MQQEASHAGDEFILLIRDFVAAIQGLSPDWNQDVYRHYHDALTDKKFRAAISNGELENIRIPEFSEHRTSVPRDVKDLEYHAADFNGKLVKYLLSSPEPLEDLCIFMMHYEYWGKTYLNIPQSQSLRHLLKIG